MLFSSLTDSTKPASEYENEQAYVRLIAYVMLGMFSIAAVREEGGPYMTVFLLFTIGIGIATAILLSSNGDHEFNVVRWRTGVVSDVTLNTVYVVGLGTYDVLALGMYLWIVLGNAVRFGHKAMWFAAILSNVGIVALFSIHPFWLENWHMPVGYWFSLIVLPIYISLLVRRMEGSEKRVLKLKETDPLTGLYNRQTIIRCLTDELVHVRTERKQNVLAAMVRIDHLEWVNQRHGELVGDKLLVAQAQALPELLRETDYIGRYGGATFMVVMPETPLAAGLQVCRRICEKAGGVITDSRVAVAGDSSSTRPSPFDRTRSTATVVVMDGSLHNGQLVPILQALGEGAQFYSDQGGNTFHSISTNRFLEKLEPEAQEV